MFLLDRQPFQVNVPSRLIGYLGIRQFLDSGTMPLTVILSLFHWSRLFWGEGGLWATVGDGVLVPVSES